LFFWVGFFLETFTIVGFWVSSGFCCCLGVYWELLLFWVLGFRRVLGVVGCLDFRGSCWVLHYGLPGLFFCILHVYLRVPYAFLMKFLLLIKKKKKVFVRVTQDLVPKNVLPDDFIQAIKYSDYSSISSLYDFIYH
jgi:hypothetical protein